MIDLKDKVCVLTGAGGLIGKTLAKGLLDAGAKVYACDVSEKALEGLGTEDGLEKHVVDITAKKSLAELRDRVLKECDRIDVLINNAAINDKFESSAHASTESKFENYPLELWQASMHVNVTGTFLASQTIGATMAKQGRGSIINVASTYGMVAPDQSLYVDKDGNQPFFKTPVYPTSKAAVLGFTKFLAAYWGHKGVRVNSLSPGGVENGQDSFFVEKYSAKTPLGRMATPKDYIGPVVFLASDSSGYMTGSNLVVDGGWTAW